MACFGSRALAVAFASVGCSALLLAACASSGNTVPGAWHLGKARHATQEHWIYATDQGSLLVYPVGVADPTPSVVAIPTNGHGVATDTAGHVYVASAEAHTISVFTPGAASVDYTIATGTTNPEGVTVDSNGNLYVANPQQNTVTEYGYEQTTVKATFTTQEAPYGGVATDSSGNLYVDVNDGTVEECNALTNSCSAVAGVQGPGPTFGGLAFVDGQLAVSGGDGLVNLFTYVAPQWSPGPQNVNYYLTGMTSRFMTSDDNGNLYIPYLKSGGFSTAPPAVVVVPVGGLGKQVITAGLNGPFGAAAGP